jgi:prepilin-type N-terminal cleavage/methylation domain-containing protein
MTLHRNRGFTLTELVAVLVIVAVLAVSVTSLFSRRDFDTASFADQARIQLAYAQKVAVAARRTVTVTVLANTISLDMCPDAACGTPVPVPSPQGEASFVRTAPAGVTIGPDATFTFRPLGDTDLPGNLTLIVTGDGTRTITVEATTGYVHE